MTEENFCLYSDRDGAPLYATEIAAEQPRFLIQILHGMAEHRGRYLPFMRFLAAHGGAAVIHDLRGHGETAGEANYGYFGDDPLEMMMRDVELVGDTLRRKYPTLPFVLLGHSMGSLIARAYAAGHDEQLSALVVLGEASYNPFVSFGLLLSHVGELFCGGHYRSPLLARLAVGTFNRGFTPEEAETAGNTFLWLSVDRRNRIAFEEDPACGFDFTLNGYIALFSFMKAAYAPKNWNVRNRTMPVLFLSGEDDPVMTDKKHFWDAVRFLRDMGYTHVDAHLYPGMRHEILNETDNDRVYGDILSFITACLAETASENSESM